jgi:hypothetical protein
MVAGQWKFYGGATSFAHMVGSSVLHVDWIALSEVQRKTPLHLFFPFLVRKISHSLTCLALPGVWEYISTGG